MLYNLSAFPREVINESRPLDAMILCDYFVCLLLVVVFFVSLLGFFVCLFCYGVHSSRIKLS